MLDRDADYNTVAKMSGAPDPKTYAGMPLCVALGLPSLSPPLCVADQILQNENLIKPSSRYMEKSS